MFGAVGAEGGFVVAADDGEGVEDVGGVCAGEAVEVEVEGVEAGAQVAAFFLVPDEGRAVVAEVAGEGGHVVGGVGEAEDVVADESSFGCRTVIYLVQNVIWETIGSILQNRSIRRTFIVSVFLAIFVAL